MTKPAIRRAATIVPVSDLDQALAFYVDLLEFEADFVSDDRDFAVVSREAVTLQLLVTDDPGALAATANNISIYLWVEDVDGLYRDLAPRLAQLPPSRVRSPFDQPYGMREFHLKDPDGFLMFFGQDLDRGQG